MPRFEAFDDATTERMERELIAAACGAYGVEAIAAELVGHSVNVVYRVTAERDGHRRDYALRISDPARYSTQQIEAECRWISAVNRETSVVSPEPLLAADGRHVVEIAPPGVPIPRRCALFAWLHGEQIDAPRPEHMRRLGAMTAELHNHADTYAPAEGIDRAHTNWEGMLARFVRGDVSAAWEGYVGTVATEDQLRVFMGAAARLTAAIREIPIDRDYGLIHADLHQWNVLYHDGEPRPIDFDDCLLSPYMTDVATTLWYLQDDEQFPALREACIAGYETRRDLPVDWQNQLAVFLAARYFAMLDWALSWPREDHMWSGLQAVSRYAERLHAYLESAD
ncbi:phosphotransferase [Candidatus Poribacteria bacterium]|jgi:Ser/Thr protein kinase RdoA (MazF antagonist)|nr:phosphotransferase [Candidatus Poribacteria bacterium]MBT5532386.1 phosphotransferase [Candidatus Poribacteria bacterium]MBT5711217.1 phosphotransferase [Candidatus Poribacteria bacterium]MBT7096397.1 phosphotransferase [Candidatus Poribacteria bacterium]MBT7804207.1 phosphotransferase [Candidatus Poribacteria bacterium]